MPNVECRIDGCQKIAWARQLCKSHLHRFYKFGNPLSGAAFRKRKENINVERQSASKKGDITYRSLSPCKYGHGYTRFTSTNRCIECSRIAANKCYKTHGRSVEQKVKNLISIKKWKSKNKHKVLQQKKREYQNNRHLYVARARKRAINKINAFPCWANKEKIAEIYKQAKEGCLHVDHVIPLQGKNVCGLHVENNLQLLSPFDNRKKSNYF